MSTQASDVGLSYLTKILQGYPQHLRSGNRQFQFIYGRLARICGWKIDGANLIISGEMGVGRKGPAKNRPLPRLAIGRVVLLQTTYKVWVWPYHSLGFTS
jgi:hypothetical protein